jgi:hypothetical protein
MKSLLLRKRAPDTIPSKPADWSMGSYPVSLPSQLMKQWRKPNTYEQQATRFTRPISPACDRYVQYLLMGANRMVPNRHRWGLQPWRCRFATYPLPNLPNQLSPHFPSGPARSPFLTKLQHLNQALSFKNPMTAVWSSDHSAIYRSLHLCLSIANDLSLVVGHKDRSEGFHNATRVSNQLLKLNADPRNTIKIKEE